MRILSLKGNTPLLVFSLDGQRYALALSCVERVVRVVEVTPLPEVPDAVSGVVNVQGRIIPVFNIRRRFQLPEREILLTDQLVIANTSRRTVALLVDETADVIERDMEKIIASENILPSIPYVEGVVKFEDGLILIHNLDTFLSLDEEKKLDAAMKER